MPINSDPNLLHPTLRKALAAVLAQLESEGMPFGIFEGYRSPERQGMLFAQGRTNPGKVVTKARPGQSYHQYGLGADIVGKPNGRWSWAVPQAWWDRLHVLGRQQGLEPLSFEAPHLQVAGLKLADLQAGKLPPGRDQTWLDNLVAHGITPK